MKVHRWDKLEQRWRGWRRWAKSVTDRLHSAGEHEERPTGNKGNLVWLLIFLCGTIRNITFFLPVSHYDPDEWAMKDGQDTSWTTLQSQQFCDGSLPSCLRVQQIDSQFGRGPEVAVLDSLCRSKTCPGVI